TTKCKQYTSEVVNKAHQEFNQDKRQVWRAGFCACSRVRHIARNGSQQSTLVWSWQQSSGSLTLLPCSKPCLASTTSNKDLKHVIEESSVSQGQSSNTRSTLVSLSRRGDCSCLTAACSVNLRMGQYLVIALLR
ncbi:hypothetical protein ANANG_G00160980, partial [Anguilla anguilla]